MCVMMYMYIVCASVHVHCVYPFIGDYVHVVGCVFRVCVCTCTLCTCIKYTIIML